MRSLRGRILAATVIVALIAVLVTALAALQLVRSVDTTAARGALSTQVDRLATARPAARDAIISGLSQLEGTDTLVGSISRAGTVAGSAMRGGRTGRGAGRRGHSTGSTATPRRARSAISTRTTT